MVAKMDEVVIDIETVPLELTELHRYCDIFEAPKIEAWREACARQDEKKAANKAATGKVGTVKAPEKPKLRSARASLHPMVGRVACVGIYVLGKEPEVLISIDEKKVLEGLYSRMSDLGDPFLITFNGIQFDVPFLLRRGSFNKVPLGDFLPVGGKFDKRHLDIWEQYGGKWTDLNATLAEYAYFAGCYDLIYGSGRQVEDWWNAMEFDEISKHCLGDIKATAGIYEWDRDFLRRFKK
jgi:DNA polymerase elongation subunit (family B)